MPPLIEKLSAFIRTHRGAKQLITQLTGVKEAAIDNILHNRTPKHKISTINALYKFFRLERDEWYKQNLKNWKINTSNMFWEFFHDLRVKAGKTRQEVSDDLRNIDTRTLERLENWETFPYCGSYTVIKLMEYYGLNEEQKWNILWYLSIAHEFKTMHTNLVTQNVVGKSENDGTVGIWQKNEKQCV